MNNLFEYLEFLIESNGKGLAIYFSNEFREMLSIIKDKSRSNTIAHKLLSIESNHQYSDTFTLVDMSDKNDTITVIPIGKIQRLIDTDDEVKNVANHVSTGGNKLVYVTYHAFLNQKKFDWSNKLWSTQRAEVKIGRYTRRILKDVMKVEFKDSSVEEFVNLYKSTFDYRRGLKDKLKFVSGDEIKKWYYEGNYSEGGGSLNNSCMRYIKCQSYFDIYVHNPDVCKMLILEEDGKLNARALIWTLKNGSTFMDRVYSVYDSDVNVFTEYAKDNGWFTYYQSSEVTGKLLVQLSKDIEYLQYPYMDTLAYYNPKTHELSDDENVWNRSEYYHLQSTNGGYENSRDVWSEWEGEYIDVDDAVWCNNADTYLRADDAIYLEYRNEWAAPKDDIVYSEQTSQSYYVDDVRWSECQQDYLYTYIEIFTNSEGEIDVCDPKRKDLYYIDDKDGRYYSKDYKSNSDQESL